VDAGALSAADLASVTRAEQEMRGLGWPAALTLPVALEAWARLARQVSDGYEADGAQYVRDLAVREWLHLAWPLLADPVVELHGRRLAQADALFMTSTEADRGDLVGRFVDLGSREGWWWRRRPAALVGDLVKDAHRLGVV
jgi:hypothetical protein